MTNVFDSLLSPPGHPFHLVRPLHIRRQTYRIKVPMGKPSTLASLSSPIAATIHEPCIDESASTDS
jgi:hypothetical protein